MTAGGGWQDQVGGVIPGIKISRFSKEKQSVVTEKIPCESSFVSMITRRLVLIYTGQTRLAKNVLQVNEGILIGFWIFLNPFVYAQIVRQRFH